MEDKPVKDSLSYDCHGFIVTKDEDQQLEDRQE